jgi:hypothetical protein
MRRTSQIMATLATAIMLTTAGLIATLAAPASAAACPFPTPGTLPNGDGKLTVLSGGTSLMTGPYSDCPRISGLAAGKVVWAWCIYLNNYNNWWYYGRVDGGSSYGWVSSERVSYTYSSDVPGQSPENTPPCS